MWREFVHLAEKRLEPFAALCARFGISRKTGYKWVNRFREDGELGLQERSRRPKNSPRQTPPEVVAQVLALRRQNPGWSSARLAEELRLRRVRPCPAPSTIDLILRRARSAELQRAAEASRTEPNYRWVLHLGPRLVFADGVVRTPVWLKDEATDFILEATLHTDVAESSLRGWLEPLLRHHHLPWRILLPREANRRTEPPSRLHSELSIWLMRIGVQVEFSFVEARSARESGADFGGIDAGHRSHLIERRPPENMLAPLVERASALTCEQACAMLEQARDHHNFAGLQVAMERRNPISLYRPSLRPLPRGLPEPMTAPDAVVRVVSEKGMITFQRRLVQIGRAFAGLTVEVKAMPYPDRHVVSFAGQMLGVADLTGVPVDSTTSVTLRPL